MTIHQLPEQRSAGVPAVDHERSVSPPRSGEPWTDEDYEILVRMCRRGCDVTSVAEELGRSESSVLNRAKRMLPFEQRGVPFDRVLTQLRACVAEDEAYDWAGHLAAVAPRRPIVNNVLPPPQYSGIQGLTDEQLTTVALAFSGRPSTEEDDGIVRTLAAEVRTRGLADAIRDRAREQVVERLDQLYPRRESHWGYQEPPW